MGRNYRLQAERRPTRVSVLVFNEMDVARERERRSAQREASLREADERQREANERLQEGAVGENAEGSGHRGGRRARPRIIARRPRAAPPAAADQPGPSGAAARGPARADNPPQGGNGSPPAAPAVEPAPSRVTFEKDEPIKNRYGIIFEVSVPEDEMPLKCPRTYTVDLEQRLLPGKGVTAAMADPASNFRLVSSEGQSFPCEGELLRNMCQFFDISSSWRVPEVHLGATEDITQALVQFASDGSITITNERISEILEAADFMGFESLLKLCAVHISGQTISRKRVLQIHERFGHNDSISKAFEERFDVLPVAMYERKSRRAVELLQSMNIAQLRRLLSSDSLLVGSEDLTVHMLETWLKKHEATAEERKSLLQQIRYPLLRRGMQGLFRKNSFGLPISDLKDLANEECCQRRIGHDRHLHILWKEHCASRNGPQNLTVSCFTWNAHINIVEETVITRFAHEPAYDEDDRSAQFAIAGTKIVKTSFNRHSDQILVSEIDFRRRTSEQKISVLLSPESVVDRPDLTIVKGYSNLTMTYYDRSTEITSIDTDTWRFQERPPPKSIRALRRFPINPARFEVCGDCAIGIIDKRLIISEPDFTHPVEVSVPVTHGYFFGMERIDDTLYILEDNSRRRSINRTVPDMLHCVDLKERVYTKSIKIPWYKDPLRLQANRDEQPEATLQLVKGERELYIFTQNNITSTLRIILFDVDTQRCEPAAEVSLPRPEYGNPYSIHARYCLCAIPPRIIPCDKSSLKELGASIVIPTAE